MSSTSTLRKSHADPHKWLEGFALLDLAETASGRRAAQGNMALEATPQQSEMGVLLRHVRETEPANGSLVAIVGWLVKKGARVGGAA
jgi:hypothetical protein